jgi:N-acetyl-anhydromuramyl-L-alanine amidase AmpD
VTHPSKPIQPRWNEALREPRIGVMLHFDASKSDQGGINWFTDPAVKVSYNYLIADSGNIIPIAPLDARAWHAGYCQSDDPRLKYRDANSAFYGLAITATVGDKATLEAKRSLALLISTLFLRHGWPRAEVWRIVSHRTQAVYEPGHPKAGQRGRKKDPEGPNLARPVLNTNEIRGMVAARPVT